MDSQGNLCAVDLQKCPLLLSLSDASPLAVIMLDQKGNVSLWSKSAEKTFGWSSQEVLGRPLPIVSKEMREDFWQHFNHLLEGGSFSGLERSGLCKNRKTVDISIAASPMKDKRGKIIAIMSLIQDISDKKRLEKEFQQAQKMEAIGRLAGGVAHDFNNLLTAIGGYASFLLASMRPGDPNRADAEEIKKAGERAAGLTRQLLAFSRQQVLQPKVLDLNAVITGIEKMIKRLIGEDLEVVAKLQPGLGRVKADPGQIEQVLMNLVVNARDAMPSGGKIAIETANVELGAYYAQTHPLRSGRYVMLAVSDTGSGMSAQTQARLFEPFFTTKEVGKGTGLGLATVYGIVKQSGGSIFVYSEPGQGTTMKIYLPRIDEAAPSAAASLTAKSSRGSETILLVEDEDTVRKVLQRILKANGYAVLAARNSTEALRLSAEKKGAIHLLIIDMVMPGMHGRELAARLVSSRPRMKVIYISGYTDQAILQHGLLEEKAVFLQKPLALETLPLKAREVLDSP